MNIIRRAWVDVNQFYISLSPFFRARKYNISAAILDRITAISHEKQYVYCRIPKAANSTVVASLNKEKINFHLKSLNKLKEIGRGYASLSQLRKHEIEAVVRDYYKFTVVRNPYLRFLSAYLDKICNSCSQKRLIANYFKSSIKRDFSLNEFADYLENGGIYQNAHWARQRDLIVFSLNELNYICKVENLKEDLQKVLREIFNIKQEVVSFRPHSTSSIKKIHLINNSLAKKIYKIYEIDFDSFGYSKYLNI